MAAVKDNLLRYFATLDVSVLERLKRYASFIIIPEEDLLTNATMAHMVEKAHSLADNLFPEWTDRSKSDFGEFLVELFALFSEKDFWYINAFANEGIFRKIRSYSNAFSKAASLGYEARTCKGAEATFAVTFGAGEAASYARGELVVTVNGREYSNDEAFTVATSQTDVIKNLVLREGKQMAEDATFNGYGILIKRPNVDISHLAVKIDGVEYTRVRTFGSSSEASAHYLVLPEEDGSCSVFFGNGGFGVTPALGKVVQLEYRVCNGDEGNQEIGDVTIDDSLDERPATSAVMLTTATGGTYAESLTSIKENAPTFFSNKKAAVNDYTAEEILNAYPFVHKSKVTSLGYNMTYQCIPKDGGLEISAAQREIIASDLDKYVMVGYSAQYSQNNYCNLLYAINTYATKIILDIVVLPGYSASTVESGVRAVMSDYTNPLALAEYGGAFNKTELEILLRSRVAGIQSVSFRYAMGVEEYAIPDFTLAETEIFREVNQDDIDVRINVAL